MNTANESAKPRVQKRTAGSIITCLRALADEEQRRKAPLTLLEGLTLAFEAECSFYAELGVIAAIKAMNADLLKQFRDNVATLETVVVSLVEQKPKSRLGLLRDYADLALRLGVVSSNRRAVALWWDHQRKLSAPVEHTPELEPSAADLAHVLKPVRTGGTKAKKLKADRRAPSLIEAEQSAGQPAAQAA